jgi:acyl-coenzyme A thioesterase PaaI-like protein
MTDAVVSHLSSVPWAAALINDPNWTPVNTASRSPKASGEDSFFAETLSTDRTIRALLTLRPIHEEDGDIAYKEVKTIVDLGDGLNGYPQIIHGGCAATLLDEMCGILIMLNMERKVQKITEDGRRAAALNYFTAYLNTTYKKPVPTPGALLLTAKIERQDAGDRKLYIRATIEDGSGTIYTVGEALFIRVSTKL